MGSDFVESFKLEFAGHKNEIIKLYKNLKEFSKSLKTNFTNGVKDIKKNILDLTDDIKEGVLDTKDNILKSSKDIIATSKSLITEIK